MSEPREGGVCLEVPQWLDESAMPLLSGMLAGLLLLVVGRR
jgi:hypothetical protein